MGGEDKENHIASPSITQDLVRDGFDTSMSRLLQDFTSAELLVNTPEMSKETNSCSDSVCETVINPMKHLHLRRPAVTKRKKSSACSLKKKTSPNSLNIAIAACKFQRPIVWPARLSGQSDRLNSQILRPSRLLTKAEAATAQEIQTPTDPRPSAEKVSQRQNCSFVFGKASVVDYSSLSFSSLCEQATKNIAEASKDVEDLNCGPAPSKDTGAGSVKPVCKRQSSTDAPPAKFARTYGAGNNPGTSQAKSPSTCESSRTSNVTLCNEPAAAPSSLETLTTLRLALSSCGQAVSQASYSQDISLDEINANELASYLEDLLHIPRKMSVMAEMMYA
ncbi:unnamed protein product [Candidula unifasciata]|uniref:Oxidative stress-responsive serine-rich protein 1 n=1 Tax=Candidula unifasciata TaxID=100452 RepID=A0A8S3Z371_9EUPU|nr:unnamed protein product [Candidula unifasciata]